VARPYVIVNAAMSLDGRIALEDRRQTRLSSEEDLSRVHRLRARADAILVGVGTVLTDDPKLTVKEAHARGKRQPLRVVLDSHGRTPLGAAVLDGKAPTLIATVEGCSETFPNAEVVRCGRGRVDLKALLELLSARGVETLLVEGGEQTITSFLSEGLVDEVKVFLRSLLIGGSTSPHLFGGPGVKTLERAVTLELSRATPMEGGILLEYRTRP
jgi:2,5-diamino-6-(ribosylamino)-4(3H)-pyrimidinone 5'-phosphate reductase